MSPDEARTFDEFVTGRGLVHVRIAYLMTANWHEAEDVVQAVLSRVYVHWPKIHRGGDADAYVRRAIINACVSGWRRPWQQRVQLTSAVPDLPAPAEEGIEDRAVVLEALLRLTPRQRAVLVLRYYEDLTEAQTAAVMACSIGTVKTLHSRGLAHLRLLIHRPSAQSSSENMREPS